MIFITISEELNYQFVFPSPPHFSKLCTIPNIYGTSYFGLIVGSSSVKNFKRKNNVHFCLLRADTTSSIDKQELTLTFSFVLQTFLRYEQKRILVMAMVRKYNKRW